MKCPLMNFYLAEDSKGKFVMGVDCIREECAWFARAENQDGTATDACVMWHLGNNLAQMFKVYFSRGMK